MHDEPLVVPKDSIGGLISALPNDRGVVLDHADGPWMYMFNLNPTRLAEWDADENKFHVVCMANRPIFHEYASHVEHTYFPPLTAQNDEFKFAYYRWQDVTFAIIQVPIDKRHLLFISASDLKMRLADGVPHMIGGDGPAHGVASTRNRMLPAHLMGFGLDLSQISVFPLQSDRTYTLEPEYKDRGPKIAGIGVLKESPPLPKPTVIDEMLERFQRRKRDGRRRDR